MDKALRNTLRLAVTRCRKLLEDAIADELQGKFGVARDGAVEGIDRLGALSVEDLAHREQILAHLQHIQAAGYAPGDTVLQLVREVAFTHLNRLVAFKLMEQRKLIREAVSRGAQSNGFKFYLAEHQDGEALAAGSQIELAYQHFLIWQGAALPGAVRLLFAPDDPANALFPPQRVLELLLAELNDPALADVWPEDETVGWVYQYFTPKELRDQVRKESAAPRNSYELAFRNQFYTPRYVVEFLVQNTLGRLWLEITAGQSGLPAGWRYFVKPDVLAPRPRKDPRDLKILDPACGSAHFLLYAFDLLEGIYAEAWDLGDAAPPSTATGHTLREDFPSREELLRALPELILRHNLHGIDIDLRATQIASLALWLRAQRAWQSLGLKAADRPVVARVNIACAEPMPGETALLEEALAAELPAIRDLARETFTQMQLAGEAGSLLKIDAALADAVADARAVWAAQPKQAQLALFETDSGPAQLRFDLSGITDAAFFDQAQERVLSALRRIAGVAGTTESYRRGLVARDTARGFDFIDLCALRYDVVLMNPPFGAASKPSQAYIEAAYPRTKNDVYAAFVERGLQLLHPGGMLGAITSRTGFFLTSFQKWREEILLKEARLTVMADLGYGVLDTAMVETAAYCLERRN